MSRIKEIRSNPEHNFNIVDLIGILCPKDKTSKYAEVFIKAMKKHMNISNQSEEVKNIFNQVYGIPKEKIEDMHDLHLVFFIRFIETMLNSEDIKTFKRFAELNERGLIVNNDLSTYKSFEDVSKQVAVAELKVFEKDLENQVKKVYEDDEWLMVRPLTYFSSKKYGSATKWCTTSEGNPDYFIRYATNGILIYMINKKSGEKVACYKVLNGENEFSFWNQKDSRIDSIESGLPFSILGIIQKEITTKPVKSNIALLSEEDRKKQNEMLRVKEKASERGGILNRALINVSRAIQVEEERVDEEIEDEGEDVEMERGEIREMYPREEAAQEETLTFRERLRDIVQRDMQNNNEFAGDVDINELLQ